MNKIKFYFVYTRKTRNQISKIYQYRRKTVRLLERLASPGQYAIGYMTIGERGIEKLGPGKINLKHELCPTLK